MRLFGIGNRGTPFPATPTGLSPNFALDLDSQWRYFLHRELPPKTERVKPNCKPPSFLHINPSHPQKKKSGTHRHAPLLGNPTTSMSKDQPSASRENSRALPICRALYSDQPAPFFRAGLSQSSCHMIYRRPPTLRCPGRIPEIKNLRPRPGERIQTQRTPCAGRVTENREGGVLAALWYTTLGL